MSEPFIFTVASLHLLLKEKVFVAKDDRPPAPDNPALVALAFGCNSLSLLYHGWSGPWGDDEKERQKIGEALWYLAGALPATRTSYTSAIAIHEKAIVDFPIIKDDCARLGTDFEEVGDRARKALIAFDALVDALQNAKAHGLPISGNAFLVSSRPTERPDLDARLFSDFRGTFPNCTDAAAHRFIKAVTMLISGEDVSVAAIRINLDRQRKAVTAGASNKSLN